MAAHGQDLQAANSHQSVKLTEVETTLRRLLLDVADYIESDPKSFNTEGQASLPDELAKEKLILRFTGGWVRDTLLGVGSHDIDVSINKMTGLQFGLRMKEYLEIPGNPEKYGLEGVAKTDSQSNKAGTTDKSKLVGGLHKIEANPEKSKHLETVTTKVLGLDIDLVNLRKETYTEESRNPQMEFGTPEEDAMRRDATVNAMFYNLNTEQVEDFTGKGHDDMRDKIIRTPLEPYQTFKDDPLRVLRLIRFASRLDYVIERAVEQCMGVPEIQEALRAKISRERVGVELEKMLKGPDPLMAASIIERLDLYRTIFSDPTEDPAHAYAPDEENWKVVINQLGEFLRGGRPDSGAMVKDQEEKFLAWILACMVPYRDAPQAQPAEAGRKMPPPVATNVAREGIKATNKVCELVTASVRNREEITTLVDKQSERRRRPNQTFQDEDPFARDVLGMAIRRWGATWRSQTVFSMLCEIADEPGAADTIIRNYGSFITTIRDLDLLEVYAVKPLIDGKALAKALQTPPGVWMKAALDVVMAWQLRNPGKTSADGAIEEVKNSKMHGELTANLVNHLLRLTIRPLFSKSQHPAVTAQGRRVTTKVLPKRFDEEPEEITKPWKNKESHAIDLLHWVVRKLDDKMVEQNWPLLVPPILSITDDPDIRFKIQGCAMVEKLLTVAPSALIAKTGLGQVFEEALMPCLGYLPTLTPEEESIPLLSAVYPALVALSNSAYTPTQSIRTSPENLKEQRIAFLDTIVRRGILAAYSHCPERVKIVEVLLQNLIILLNELGIESVKHLKYLFTMLNEILGNSFSTAYPPVLLSAVKATQAVILNGWPRMLANRAEVLRGLTICWLQIKESGNGSDEFEEVKKEMVTTVQMLHAVVKDDCDFKADCAALVQADGRLSELLKLAS
ncbi:hypothetical protein MBLNU457_1341t2 [Dothideomycetes sp. NU457]